MQNTSVNILGRGNDKIYPYINNDDLKFKLPSIEQEKRFPRSYMLLNNTDQKICITTRTNYYFIAHLTQADLSMLNDFDDITGELSIVIGSFVTLRDTLIYHGASVGNQSGILCS